MTKTKRKPGPAKAETPLTAEQVEQAQHVAEMSKDEHAIHSRRYKLLQLMALRQLSYREIAGQLGVTTRTVERDLHEIRAGWRKLYGKGSKFDAAEAIGEAIELYASVEEAAHREYLSLRRDQLGEAAADLRKAAALPDNAPNRADLLAAAAEAVAAMTANALKFARERGRALRLVMDARLRRVSFLQDVGLLDRNLGTLELPDELRNATGNVLDEWEKAMAQAQHELLPPAERAAAAPAKAKRVH